MEKKAPNEVVYDIRLRDEAGNTFYDKLQFIYLDVPNFKKREGELETRLDKWLYFIKNLEGFQSIPEIFKHEVVFLDALQKAELAKFDEAQMYNYEANLKSYRDSINQQRTALRMGREQGLAEGRMESERMWRQLEKNKIAIALKAAGIPYQTISETTGLTFEEIEQL